MSTKNGTGQGGKNFQDRELAARVRTLTLEQIEKVLKGKLTNFKKEVILRLAGTILPRLNVVSGDDDGGPVQITVVKYAKPKDGLNT